VIAVSGEPPSRWTLITQAIRAKVREFAAAAARVTARIVDDVGRVAKRIGLPIAAPVLIAAAGLIGLMLLLRAVPSARGAVQERSAS
jgi:hypothetical protein